MAFCSNCGMQIEDKAKFCPFCGSQIAAQTPAEPAPVEKKNIVRDEPDEQKPTFAETKVYTIPETVVQAQEVEVSAEEVPAYEEPAYETTKKPEPAPEVPTHTFSSTPAPEKASGVLNVGMLVWSILNLIFCCLPVAIASLIFTISAKDAATATEEAKKLKTAKTLNLIATIGGAIINILYIVLFVVLVMLGVMGGTGAI